MLDKTAYLLFLGAGLYGTRHGFGELLQAYRSRSWPNTTGVILTSKRRVEKNEEGEATRCLILYFYEVGGVPFRSGRVGCGDARGLGFGSTLRRYAATYPAGKAVNGYYDPAAPATALLEPGLNLTACVACLLPLLLALWGMVCLVARLAGYYPFSSLFLRP
jgi:hypothetical protein